MIKITDVIRRPLITEKTTLLREDGRTLVFASGRTYQELASNKLAGRFMASPAAVGNSLVLRTDTHLYRIDR